MSARRVGPADGGSARGFRLPRTPIPQPLMKGMRGWRTTEGWMVLRLHYTADPERATEEWVRDRLLGYRGGKEGRDWRREMEIDFSAYAGEPVYSQFNPAVSVRATQYNPHLPLWRGWDFGYRHPAVVWAQLWPATPEAPNGVLVYLHELYPTLDSEAVPGVKTDDLVRMVLAETRERFPETPAGVYDFCDPAGNQTKETSDFSSIEILQQHGIDPEWSVVGRKNRINYLRNYVEEGEAFRINPHCVLGIKALSAAYRYPVEREGTSDRDMPDLGKKVQEEPYVHVMDALEYIAACNLQIEWAPRPTGPSSDTKLIGELAEMLLGPSRTDDRLATGPPAPIESELERMLGDLVGEEGDISQAWGPMVV